MTSVTQIIHMRQRRREAAGRNPTAKIGQSLGCLISMLIAGSAFLASLAYAELTRDLPSIDQMPALLDSPDGILLQPTRLYDRTGEHVIAILENPYSSGRQYLSLQDESPEPVLISSTMISATLSTADPEFWQHAGFTMDGILQDAHPTLAQRMVAVFLLSDERPGMRRALRERLLAFQLTHRFGRKKVLEWYLNSANYGHLAFGADAAARLYLNKSAADLSVAEAALLAAVAEAPAFNPIDDPKTALDRQKTAILRMLQYQTIRPEAGIQAIREQVGLRALNTPEERLRLDRPQANLAPTFTSLALAQLETGMSRRRFERGGLRILTTLDYDLQTQASCAAATQIARLENRPLAPAWENFDCPARNLLPTLPFQPQAAFGRLQADLEVLDPHSGQIIALLSQPDPEIDSFTSHSHQAGTLSTPFIFLTAFTQGLSPASLAWDIPAQGISASTQNFDDPFHGPVRLRLALANDYLIPAAQLIDQVGAENIWRIARQSGLVSPELIAAPGTSPLDLFGEISILQAAQAFGVLANQGVQAGRNLNANRNSSPLAEANVSFLPTAILRVEDTRGNVWLDWSDAETRPILTPQLAYLITDALSDEPARWPSLGQPNPLEIGRPAAAKIGQTADGESSWVLGYTAQYVVGVWIGLAADSAAPPPDLETSQPLTIAASGLWYAAAQTAHQGLTRGEWIIPPGMSFLEVCDPSGMLPTPECPNIVEEVFLNGNEPFQEDNLYRSMQVNRETGRLATVFTPADLLDEQVFLVVPPEAQLWAQAAGMPLPPELYDFIPAKLPAWNDASLQTPDMFAVVGGVVPVHGNASGKDFELYRIQVGQGLNPQAWLQIGTDTDSRVVNGKLGTWDTSGLDGLYAVQLLVIHKDQSVRRTTVLVTVDNQAPQAEIVYPMNGLQISEKDKKSLVFQVEAQDNLALQSVTLFLDGKLLATFIQLPFAVAWDLSPGKHHLKVVVVDKAGNSSENLVNFDIIE